MKRIWGLFFVFLCTTVYAEGTFRTMGPVDDAPNWILSRHSNENVCAVSAFYKEVGDEPDNPQDHDIITFLYQTSKWSIIFGKTKPGPWELPPDSTVTRSITVGSITWYFRLKVMKSGLWAPISDKFIEGLIGSPEMIVRANDNELIGRFPIETLPKAIYATYECVLSQEA